MESEILSNRAKIENLENWVIKQNKSIEDLDQKLSRLDKNGILVKESSDTESLHKKVIGIEIDFNFLKKSSLKKNEKMEPLNPKTNAKKCNACDTVFSKNSDLEKHVIDEHEQEKNYKCKVCSKQFFLEWRKDKHSKMHEEETDVHFRNVGG